MVKSPRQMPQKPAAPDGHGPSTAERPSDVTSASLHDAGLRETRHRAAAEAGPSGAAAGPAPSPDERRAAALEDIATSLRSIRTYAADISLWIAHIGRNLPTGRNF